MSAEGAAAGRGSTDNRVVTFATERRPEGDPPGPPAHDDPGRNDMSAENVATLYMQLDDDEQARSAIAGGDFGSLELTAAEAELIRAAASEQLPEVIGFGNTLLLPARHAAIDYVGKNLTAPGAQAGWLTFFDERQLAHIAPGQ